MEFERHVESTSFRIKLNGHKPCRSSLTPRQGKGSRQYQNPYITNSHRSKWAHMLEFDSFSNVFTLKLGDGQNLFNPLTIESINESLSLVEAHAGPKSLVTSAEGKFWCNGLDLDWIMANAESTQQYIADVEALLARFLTLSVPTVAAIQGHCFGAGAMLALAHDFRVMRLDRGYFCLPEVDLGIVFSRGMGALIQSKLTAQAAHLTMLTGRRVGGTEALDLGIVDAAVAEQELTVKATEIASPLSAKAGDVLKQIKLNMYQNSYIALSGDS
ncbi:enoyl-CoA hydratase-related protein [Streptomyces sp. 3211]|uniref:enoyl-CoA hydratase-related protein n=1 Tax=Streptomyces sp. 3211 TaxID=1964449 RepID=UPI0017DD4827